MKEIYIAFVLAIIPIISFALQYVFAKRTEALEAFRKHGFVYYLDWIFIPFNFLWIYVSSFNILVIISALVISIGGNFYLHFVHWLNLNVKKKEPSHIYQTEKKRLAPAGYVHLIFSLIQTTLVITFLFSNITSILSYINLALLAIFFYASFHLSKRLHGSVQTSDKIIAGTGLLYIIIRIILSF